LLIFRDLITAGEMMVIPVKRCDRGSVATLQEWSDKLADMVLAPSVAGLFKWRQFEPEVILLAVGWYLRFFAFLS
jgi:hypothetical protein